LTTNALPVGAGVAWPLGPALLVPRYSARSAPSTRIARSAGPGSVNVRRFCSA
jgi:hypothetical protein